MVRTQLDTASVFFEDPLQIGALDPAGEIGGDLGKPPAVVEFEIERFVVAGDDLRGQGFRLDQGPGGGDGCLLEGVLELARRCPASRSS